MFSVMKELDYKILLSIPSGVYANRIKMIDIYKIKNGKVGKLFFIQQST